jgi:hypothetical protein
VRYATEIVFATGGHSRRELRRPGHRSHSPTHCDELPIPTCPADLALFLRTDVVVSRVRTDVVVSCVRAGVAQFDRDDLGDSGQLCLLALTVSSLVARTLSTSHSRWPTVQPSHTTLRITRPLTTTFRPMTLRPLFARRFARKKPSMVPQSTAVPGKSVISRHFCRNASRHPLRKAPRVARGEKLLLLPARGSRPRIACLRSRHGHSRA